MPELGNRNVKLNRPGICIDKPEAARDLLQRALHYARQKRRVLFFCSCKDLDAKTCHRTKVADLVLKEATRKRHAIEIVEWPGGKPASTQIAVTVTPAIQKAVARGEQNGRKNIPLRKNSNLDELIGLPWGSIVNLHAGDRVLPIVSGPAKYQGGWQLRVLRCGKIGGDADQLNQWAVNFRRRKGLEPRFR